PALSPLMSSWPSAEKSSDKMAAEATGGCGGASAATFCGAGTAACGTSANEEYATNPEPGPRTPTSSTTAVTILIFVYFMAHTIPWAKVAIRAETNASAVRPAAISAAVRAV